VVRGVVTCTPSLFTLFGGLIQSFLVYYTYIHASAGEDEDINMLCNVEKSPPLVMSSSWRGLCLLRTLYVSGGTTFDFIPLDVAERTQETGMEAWSLIP
jgi:hypothetical protein